MMTRQQSLDILGKADLICPAGDVNAAVVRVASEITAELSQLHPVLLSVMGGAVVFTGQLLPLLDFPLDFDYVHVSRYGHYQRGGALEWKVRPRECLKNRTVLVVDDVLDEGETMAAIRQYVMEAGASRFYCAVFADKQKKQPKPLQADFIGLQLPDRYIFGFGMDIQGAWRNLPAIYAVKEG